MLHSKVTYYGLKGALPKSINFYSLNINFTKIYSTLYLTWVLTRVLFGLTDRAFIVLMFHHILSTQMLILKFKCTKIVTQTLPRQEVPAKVTPANAVADITDGSNLIWISVGSITGINPFAKDTRKQYYKL